MATLGLDQLPADARAELAQGKTLEIIDGDAVVARLVPVAPPRVVRAGLHADLTALDALSARISAAWKDDMSATDAVNDVRRAL